MGEMKKYIADHVSGGEGCILFLSMMPEIVEEYNKTARFKFPFHGVNIFSEKRNWFEFIDAAGYRKAAEEVTDHVMKNGLDYFWKQVKNVEKISLDFEKHVREIIVDISDVSDEQLEDAYTQFIKLYVQAYAPGIITFLYELYLPEILMESMSDSMGDFSKIIDSLNNMGYKSFMIEGEDFLKKIKKSKDAKERRNLIDEYKDKFFYIKSNYEYGKILDDTDVEELMKGIHDGNKTGKSIKRPELNKKEKAIIDLMEPTIIVRDIRKKINLMGSYAFTRFMEQVSLRAHVKKDILRNSFWFELFGVFKDKKLVERLKNRKEASVVFEHGKIIHSDKIIIEPRKQNVSGLKGTIASLGKAKGRVRIINGPSEFSRFEQGEILVTFATRPEFLSVMKKSAAIITQEGGLTSHAAIVARELGKPCIVGIPCLIESLNDGDLVEVDAEKGIVRKLG